MRVSDELVERLGYALDACEFKTPYADVPSMLRRILEDVLLHVPEPLPALSGPAGVEKYVDALTRAVVLEAKLARVREMAKAEFPSHFEQRVLAILDGKEGTCA